LIQTSARLKPGVTLAQAEAQLAPLALTTQQVRPWSNKSVTIALQPMQEAIVGSLRQPLWLLLAVVATVLLIACANVANLVLIRSVSRQREVAIRTALGASRWQIVRQLLIENLTLAAMGGIAGLLLAVWLQSALPLLLPDSVLRFAQPSIDWRVLAFTATLVVAIGLFSGIAPALLVSRRPPQSALQEASRGSSGGPQRHRLGASLVVAEIALALMLLVGAGLFVRSFVRLLSVDPGIKPEGLAVMTVSLPPVSYAEPEQSVQFYDRLLEGARQVPGVRIAGLANNVPFRDRGVGLGAPVEGRPPQPGRFDGYFYRTISPDYFATLGVPMRQGRAFTADDRAGRPRVTIINETAARQYFAHENPIGLHLLPDDGVEGSVEVVGVVADVKHFGLGEETQAEMFVPFMQTPPFIWRASNRTLNLVIRTASTDATAVVPSIREVVRRLDPAVPTYRVASMTSVLEQSTATPQRYMVVVSVFGSIALALAAIGIYGVMTFLVRQRTHEIGVRIALGAARRDVLQLVFGRVLRLTTIGLIIGIALALSLARWLGTFLFEIKPTDALTYLGGGVVLFAVALLAAYVPAFRATRIDPVSALRVE
jgi:putative ABC transport system permease protein